MGGSLVLGVARSVYAGGLAVEGIRNRVVEQVEAGLRQDAPRLHTVLEERTAESFGELKTQLGRRMGSLVDELETCVTQLLARRAEGEAALARERARLASLEAEFREIARDLEKWKGSLVGAGE